MNKPVTLPWAQAVWQRSRPSMAAWTAHALPPPILDEADRTPADPDALVGLAVVLDVLCTRTRTLQADAGPRVLALLAELAWQAGAQGTDRHASLPRLLQLAESGAASERARLSETLCAELCRHAEAAGVRGVPGLASEAASAPETVLAAARRLESAAKEVVQEACFNLATRSVLDYRPI